MPPSVIIPAIVEETKPVPVQLKPVVMTAKVVEVPYKVRMEVVNGMTHVELVRGDDGLFRQRSGAAAEPDAAVRVQSGAVEGSNVNVVDAMVSMIALSRQFDMQLKLLQNADANDRQAAQLLSMNR